MSGLQLTVLDLILLVGSMIASAAIGFYFTNKNKSIEAYMLGDRQLSVLPVAISLMTSTMSGLSLLGSSSELYYSGPAYSFVIISMLLCGPITALTVLPVFYNLKELSLYNYLERRFNKAIKHLAVLMFMLHMLFYNAVVLYLPALALETILGVSRFYSILGIGIMCVLYSSVGGIKAVVWTDFFQAVLMYASVGSVAWLGMRDAGGYTAMINEAREGGRLELEPGFMTTSITERHTLLFLVLGSTIKHTYTVGVNQVQIQRALSMGTLRKGQWSLVFSSVFIALISAVSSFLGLVIYAHYRSCDPFVAGEIGRRDALLVHFIGHRLGYVPGLRGLFVAGVFSATLSTLSSFANSMAALALEDYVKPIMRAMRSLRNKHTNEGEIVLSDANATLLAKILSTVFGLLVVALAYVIENANSRLLQASTLAGGALGVPFVCIFLLGIYTRFVNSTGSLVGLICALACGIYITVVQTFFSSPLAPSRFTYYDGQDGTCAAIFNRTCTSMTCSAPPGDIVIKDFIQPPTLVEPRAENLSYMAVPVFQLVVTSVVSILASLVSGGWCARHKVPAELVAGGEKASDCAYDPSFDPIATELRSVRPLAYQGSMRQQRL